MNTFIPFARKLFIYSLVSTILVASDSSDTSGKPELVGAISRSTTGLSSTLVPEGERDPNGAGVYGFFKWVASCCGCGRPEPTTGAPHVRVGGMSGFSEENPLAPRRGMLELGSQELGGTPVAPRSGVDVMLSDDAIKLRQYLRDRRASPFNCGLVEDPDCAARSCCVATVGCGLLFSWGGTVVPHVLVSETWFKDVPTFFGSSPVPYELEDSSANPLLANGWVVGTHTLLMPLYAAKLFEVFQATGKGCFRRFCAERRGYADDERFRMSRSQIIRRASILTAMLAVGMLDVAVDIQSWLTTIDTRAALDAVGVASALPFFMLEMGQHLDEVSELISKVIYGESTRDARVRIQEKARTIQRVFSEMNDAEIESSHGKYGSRLGMLKVLQDVIGTYEPRRSRWNAFIDPIQETERGLLDRVVCSTRPRAPDLCARLWRTSQAFTGTFDDEGMRYILPSAVINIAGAGGTFLIGQGALSLLLKNAGLDPAVADGLGSLAGAGIASLRFRKGMKDLPRALKRWNNFFCSRKGKGRDCISRWGLCTTRPGDACCGLSRDVLRMTNLPAALLLSSRNLRPLLSALTQGDVASVAVFGSSMVVAGSGVESEFRQQYRRKLFRILAPRPGLSADSVVNRAHLLWLAESLEVEALHAPDGVIALMDSVDAIPKESADEAFDDAVGADIADNPLVAASAV